MIDRLRHDLGQIEDRLAVLIANSPIRWFDLERRMLTIANAPKYYFETPTAAQASEQLGLIETFDGWHSRFRLLFAKTS